MKAATETEAENDNDTKAEVNSDMNTEISDGVKAEVDVVKAEFKEEEKKIKIEED